MSKASVFFADGFEEIEALTAVDLLRRGGVQVDMVSVGEGLERTGAHGVKVLCEHTLAQARWDSADMLVLPGGWPGAENLCRSEPLRAKLLEFAADPRRWIGAICAAPYVLGSLGLLRGRRATCYPGFEEKLEGAVATGARVERDGRIITGRGPGAATEFALALLEALEGGQKAGEVRDGLTL
ncbi:DJ-1/PfpI family protein [Mesosutterella sp. OilRF-GAM-744-9]|uniref:DJ-1/PfpI family protein n=1 Tax=Mesosutterella porci TaxID=2915351 RepID=A0ABS9MTW5_9BURK|nr:DJ-1 family glyoxalase III [Mesosutterella sp. oilRF-744-WT-GAM-9]MCG5031448.1 DJ-1/PfpI family protein [Mesosutterella sp. oilRF-744-WT-GAM-9]